MPQVRVSGDLVSTFSPSSVFRAPQDECTSDDLTSVVAPDLRLPLKNKRMEINVSNS